MKISLQNLFLDMFKRFNKVEDPILLEYKNQLSLLHSFTK